MNTFKKSVIGILLIVAVFVVIALIFNFAQGTL